MEAYVHQMTIAFHFVTIPFFASKYGSGVVLKNILNNECTKWLAFVICAFLFAFSSFQQAEIRSASQFRDSYKLVWHASNIWIKSTECAIHSGAWLAICEDGKESTQLIPIAARAGADDPGHAFFLDIKSLISKRVATPLDIASLNNCINLAGVLTIAITLFLLRAYIASLMWLIFSGSVFYRFLDAQPHPAFTGIVALAMILPIAICCWGRESISYQRRIFILFLGLISLAIVTLVREPIGTMAFGVSILFILWRKFFCSFKISNSHTAALFLLVLISANSPKILLTTRDTIFPMQSTDMIETHGTSHNLYLGLGAIPNKFGIQWNDQDGIDAVQSYDKSIKYLTHEYFSTLWKAYFSRLKENPNEVARIYEEKAKIVLKDKFPMWGPNLWMFLAIQFVTMGMILGPRFSSKNSDISSIFFPIIWVSLAFISLFILQGVLANPGRLYSEPIGALVLFAACFLLDVGLKTVKAALQSSPPSRGNTPDAAG